MSPLWRLSLLAALTLAVLPARAQSDVPRAKDVIAPNVYVSVEPVPRGRAFELAIVLKIRPGFHINARDASADYLIPTDVKTELPEGLRAGNAIYPKGKLRRFSFAPEKPLNVYDGTAVIRLPLTALANAPLGAQRIPIKLRYQACNHELCLPPVTLPLEASLEIAHEGAAARMMHPEVFNAK